MSRFYIVSMLFMMCLSLLFSIFVLGFVVTTAQAGDKVKWERIVGIIQPGGIVGDVVEGTRAP